MESIFDKKYIPRTFTSYSEFANSKSACRICSVGNVYNQVVQSWGNKVNPKVVIVGEAPGQDELEQGIPFVGKCGKLLRATLKKYGFNETNCLITNTIPCRPENNQFPSDEKIIHTCKNIWLKNELILLNPDYLLLIGAKSLKFLLGMEGISKSRGIWYKRKINNKSIKLMATFHPSYVLRVQYSVDKKYVLTSFETDIMSVGKEAGFNV